MKLEHHEVYGHPDRKFWMLTIGPLRIDSFGWGLFWNKRFLGQLRCDDCQRFSAGCSEHWFCDLCAGCARREEAE